MRVLLVEDNDGDADLVTDALSAALNADVEVERVVRLRDATERLEQERFDVVLLDLTLPDAMGFEGLSRLRVSVPHAPIVVLTGHRDPAKGVEAIQQGAQDYLQKGHAQGPDLLRALRFAHERAQYAERSQILAEVSAALGGSLDPTTMLGALRTTLERSFASWFDSGELRRLDVARSDEPIGAPTFVARSSRLVPALTAIEAGEAEAASFGEMIALGLASAILVPVCARGMLETTFRFGRRASSPAYGPLDLSLAEEIARRVVAAIEYADLVAFAQREREKAEVAGRVRDEFLATLSHELRTPLTAILGWTHLLRAGSVAPAKQPRVFDTIERNARAQVALIEDVLDVSRIITGKLRLNVRDIALGSTLSAALESITPTAAVKGVTVELVVDGDLPHVQGDPDRLHQILWNVLSNAVKYTKRGGDVVVRAHASDALVSVVVSDTGAGIDAEVLPHVFERFWQVDSSVTRSHGGLGLGLAITRHLVELQGGTIVAESPGLGAGSTFTIHLPLGIDGVEAPRSETPSSLLLEAQVVGVERRLEGLKVLLVEDDPDARDLMTVMLETMGALVSAAASASEGMTLLGRGRHDIIVSDIGMSETSGYAFLRSVRMLPENLGGLTPSLAVTAYASEEDRSRVQAAGFDEHLAKPVDPALLVSAVLRLVALRPQLAG